MIKKEKLSVGNRIKSSIIIDSNVLIDTFDPASPNYEASFNFMGHICKNKILFAMPMHGWFEFICTLNKIHEKRGIFPPCIAGYQIEFIHIDDQFIEKYSDVEVPIIKAMDHLFLVVAKKNHLALVTWDKQLSSAAKQCGVNVYSPHEWMEVKSAV